MKTITLKQTTLAVAGQQQALTTIELIKASINNVPQEGVDITEMQKRLRVAKAVEENDSKEVLVLEDADADTLRKCVDAMRWAIVDPFIVDFVESLQ